MRSAVASAKADDSGSDDSLVSDPYFVMLLVRTSVVPNADSLVAVSTSRAEMSYVGTDEDEEGDDNDGGFSSDSDENADKLPAVSEKEVAASPTTSQPEQQQRQTRARGSRKPGEKRTIIAVTQNPFQTVSAMNLMGANAGLGRAKQSQQQPRQKSLVNDAAAAEPEKLIRSRVDLRNMSAFSATTRHSLPELNVVPATPPTTLDRMTAEGGTRRRSRRRFQFKIAVIIGPLDSADAANQVRDLWNNRSRAVMPRAALADAISTQFNLGVAMDPGIITGPSTYWDVKLSRNVLTIELKPQYVEEFERQKPPHQKTATAASLTRKTTIQLDNPKLMSLFEIDCAANRQTTAAAPPPTSESASSLSGSLGTVYKRKR